MNATAPHAEAVRGRRRHSIAHAEDPGHPGTYIAR
jgi:hypothetical protein